MILVTGGFGYLGGRICKSLINSGNKVRIGTSRKNVSIPKELSKCDVCEIDLLKPQSLDIACYGVTSIIHLAALGANDSDLYPERALAINGTGTLNLLTSAVSNKVQKFIYFSSIHVYGAMLDGEINEETVPRPSNHYSITHKLAEDYVLNADRSNNISGSVLRLSNVIGSPLNKEVNCWSLVAHDLCMQVVKSKSMQLFSDKEVRRDFIGISNLCKIVSYCIFDENVFGQIKGDVVNITNGRSLSLNTLIEIIADQSERLFNFTPKIQYNASSKKNKGALVISNQKAKRIGFDLESDLQGEINSLLLNCNKWFSP